MFLIIWAMKIVLYPEYHHLPHVIKLKIKFSILCSRSSEARGTRESHGQKKQNIGIIALLQSHAVVFILFAI